MEAQMANTLASVASHDETVRCLLAIELSKKSWIIAANSPLLDRIGRYSLEACDWKGLLERIVSVSPFARCLLEVVAR
jgi:transposase